MSTTTPTRFGEGQSHEKSHVSPSMITTSGLLTPPSPHDLETRRDSIASSQTSMSYGSCLSEYSLPATPTYGQSPMASSGFPEAMSYDRFQEMHTQHLHGLPMSYPSKTFASEDNSLYCPWTMVTRNTDLNAPIPSQEQHAFPHAGEFYQSFMTDHTDFEVSEMAPNPTAWDNLSTAIHSDVERQWSSLALSHAAPEETVFWTDPLQAPRGTHVMTTIPMEATVGVEDDYGHVVPSPSTSHSFEDLGRLFPEPPQEVSFKKEASPLPKLEDDNEESSIRLTRSIVASSNGGKLVGKKSLSGEDDSKRKKKRSRRNNNLPEGVDIRYDEVKRRWVPVDKPVGKEKFGCPKCPKQFVRQEHLERHKKTHDGKRPFVCPVTKTRACTRRFNRHDNCVAHLNTHIRKPGKMDGRNEKMSLEEVEAFYADRPKVVERIRSLYLSEISKILA